MVGCCFLTYWERSTNFACSESILILTFDRWDLVLQERPMHDKHLHLVCFGSSADGKHDLARIDHGFLWIVFLMHLFFKLWAWWSSLFSESFPVSRSSLLDYVFWNWKKVQRIHNETSIGHCFFQENVRMCNRRCLHSNMMGMLCTPSQTIQTAQCCPRPESFSLPSHWTGCRLCLVVDRVEEHVDLGGSRSS